MQELAKKGNKKALKVYEEIGHNLGIGLLNISYVLDPEIIILGGSFGKVKFLLEVHDENFPWRRFG